jgi:Na+/H+ antiporter NhaD/arsenite permease-like protein
VTGGLHDWLTWLWFTVTYAGLALGKIPGLRIDRTGIALVGSALVLATCVLTFDQAVRAVDFATLALLLGMMIVVAYLREAMFFDLLAGWGLARVRNPRGLLAVTMALSGLLSAFLVNDVVCLALTPLVLHISRRLHMDPKPHLLGLALAANIGSTATLTGNPQNMIIGNLSHISYLRFASRLAPIAVTGLVLGFAIVAWVCRTALRPVDDPVEMMKRAARTAGNGATKPLRRPQSCLLVKGLVVMLGTITLFFAGAPMEIVALGAAALLLLDRVNPRKIYSQLDWGLLVMFAGLFVVVRAFQDHVVSSWNMEAWGFLHQDPIGLLSIVSAVLSNLVSNVPAVLLFEPAIKAMAPGVQETAWLALAMSSTLAGNLTVLGSVANLIVVENARREGVDISFWQYVKVGVPVTLLTLCVGVAWLHFVPY